MLHGMKTSMVPRAGLSAARVALAVRPLAHCPSPRRASTTTSAAVGDVHSHAADGPQPETLFRPDAAALGAAGAGGGEAEERKEEQLPGFQSMPHPDYQVERPQEQTPPEPDNPLPSSLPSNQPGEGEEAPDRPLEVPLPRREEPGDLPQAPPDIVPSQFPQESPIQPSPPTEVPLSPAPPEFSPGAPSELPDRGGSEISFPRG
ncbi:hypothetical protein C2E20_1552 [Micractinium conductrix]|uniref:Uncharacterized protein n=1 Tax=Micractinium conductrix TaxID=554055 RepID=A0A2P6VP29_9CHLO|nr:hypothetical protein C2E20_1552 [Micractinium conductrix]|eukprot:PSC75830.1 hypothetical protein C2E20_1552 [Micractinium conductrix]